MTHYRFSILRTLLLPAVLLLGGGTVSGQSQRIVLPDTRLSVQNALSEIEKQAKIGVVYNSRLFDGTRTVEFPERELTAEQAMKTITTGTEFGYSFSGKMVAITGTPRTAETPAHAAVSPDDGYRRSRESDFDRRPSRRPERSSRTFVDTIVTVKQVERLLEPEPGEFTSYGSPVWQYAANQGQLPRFAIKTNLLYGAVALTPNLAFEIGTGRRTSLEISGSYNPWNRSGSLAKNKKLVHMILKPEFRWWLCERFNGHFFGVHGIYARYNIGTHRIPLLFKKEYRYDGWAAGGGISYGYHWAFAKRWGLEAGVGVGVVHLKYDRYDCAACNRNSQKYTKTYVGPTDASVSLIFLFK
ncbi:MAG: DUF3575 domain-containing protein [Rikenellaceae bacterium]|nr:DUF3575 domain-containing protein [Rikenellaceae bacterium]